MIQRVGTKRSVGVIGSGLAGLTAACTLAARGHRVTLLEKNEWVGGKAAVWKQDGFRFDMGPTILTLPSVLRRVYEEAGKRMEDHLELVALDPQWRCFFEDGSTLDLVADVRQMQENLRRFSATPTAAAEGYGRFIEMSRQLHDVSDRFFFWKSVGGIADTLEFKGAFSPAVLRDVLSLRMGKSVAQVVRQYVPDEKAAQMIDHFTQYVGSSPEASPAVLCGIAHMQTEEGGERLEFDAVVSNCDAVRTHRELMAKTPADDRFEKRRKYEPACSGVVLYLGLKKKYDHLLHHNFVFSRDPHEEFEAIYRRGEPAPDPTAYLCAPSISEPQVAPPGGEALYILVHTPYLREHHDWKKMLPEYREVILRKLETTGKMPDIRERIVTENALTPEGIHKRYRVLQGAIYGLASHGKYLGAFKPANRSPDMRGLYLAGGAAHPGPGMPMVMMSGWIAADALDQDAQKGLLEKTR